jgi:hypothetical protein
MLRGTSPAPTPILRVSAELELAALSLPILVDLSIHRPGGGPWT